jgi:hypothetical protein
MLVVGQLESLGQEAIEHAMRSGAGYIDPPPAPLARFPGWVPLNVMLRAQRLP